MIATSVTLLNFSQHIVNFADREFVFCSRADGLEFLVDAAHWFLAPRQVQRLPDPFGDRHMPRTSHALDFPVIRIPENNLQSFSHDMSLSDS